MGLDISGLHDESIRSEMKIVYESPASSDRYRIFRQIRRGDTVYVLEPFHACHHRGSARFFPPPFPSFVKRLVSNGSVRLITAKEIGAREFFLAALDQAVEDLTEVFLGFKRRHRRLIEFTCRTLDSNDAELAFQKQFCDLLADVISIRLLVRRLADLFGSDQFVFYPSINGFVLREFSSLSPHYAMPSNVCFRSRMSAKTILEMILPLVAAAWQGLIGFFPPSRPVSDPLKKYRYAFGVSAPGRQLAGTQRGPDFLIDDSIIRQENCCYVSWIHLKPKQRRRLMETSGDTYEVPSFGRLPSGRLAWFHLFLLCLLEIKYPVLSRTAISLLHTTFSWKHLLKKVNFENFITHCDFSVASIARAIVFRRAAITTWYFTDSMNSALSFQTGKCQCRCPLWTYLFYDHFVTWSCFLGEYYKSHPNRIGTVDVVGCLWSSHVSKPEKGDIFRIAVYPSTYSVNGLTSYEEGIAFLEHILRLADRFENIEIIIKEKKDDSFNLAVAPMQGALLIDARNKMKTHSRVRVLDETADTSSLMSTADLVISFPFTSTTYEALCSGRSALWHDPLCCYCDTPYAKLDGLVTHGFEALRERVRQQLSGLEEVSNQVIENSPLFDPYRDGKAIERFRTLLATS